MPVRPSTFLVILLAIPLGGAATAWIAVGAVEQPPAGDARREATYSGFTPGGNGGTFRWSLDPAPVPVRRDDLQGALAHVVRLDVTLDALPGGGVRFVAFVDQETGLDVAVAAQCGLAQRRLACDDLGLVEWAHGSSVAFFGAFLLPALAWEEGRASLLVDGRPVAFSVERVDEGHLLKPLGHAPRTAGLCNLLDDEVLLDESRTAILECRPRDGSGDLLRLTGPAPRLPAPTAPGLVREPRRPFGTPLPLSGVLPPGADFRLHPEAVSVQEAHDGAREASKTFDRWLREHPSAILHSAQPTGSGSAKTTSAMSVHEARMELRFATGSADGYRVLVARERHDLLGTSLPPRFVVLEEGPWSLGAGKDAASQRPTRSVPLDDAVEGALGALPGVPFSRLEVTTLPAGGTTSYVVTLASDAFCPSGLACVMATLQVDAGTGRLLAASLPGEALTRLLMGPGWDVGATG